VSVLAIVTGCIESANRARGAFPCDHPGTAVGPVLGQGDWTYEVKISSPAFTDGNVSFGPAKARLSFLML